MDANRVYTINDIAPQSDWQLGTLRGDNKTSSDDARITRVWKTPQESELTPWGATALHPTQVAWPEPLEPLPGHARAPSVVRG